MIKISDQLAYQQLPDLFTDRLSQIIEAPLLHTVLNSFTEKKPTCFRVNTLKTSIEPLIHKLSAQNFNITPVEWMDNAFFIPDQQRRQLTESDSFYQGEIYIQNLSSMIAPIILNPQAGEAILDLASAPGGKTSQIAAQMNNKGQISAVESVKSRFYKLKSNLEQQGVTIAKTYLTDGRSVGGKCPERFDRVLLDAPCSSEARFRTQNPDSWSHWNLKKIKEVSRKQKRLLISAFHSLKPNGTLVYCTCSFAPEENEMVINNLLKKFPQHISIEPVELPINNHIPGLLQWSGKKLATDVGKSIRILPDTLMDGFFLCKIRKVQSVN